MNNKSGFILIVVLGLLGTLAFLSISLIDRAHSSISLSQDYVDGIHARLLVRAGVEKVSAEYMRRLDIIFQGNEKNSGVLGNSVGRGTYTKGGNRYRAIYQDAGGMLNVDDGLKAGIQELSTQYDPSHLDPNSGTGDQMTSGLINLRIRRLLNAYGDVHRFNAEIGWPDEVPAAPKFGTSFTFTSSSALGRQDPMPIGDGLGDVILQARPLTGFQSINSFKSTILEWSDRHNLGGYSHLQGYDNFFQMVTQDLTVASYEDKEFFRLKSEESIYKEHSSQNPFLKYFDTADLERDGISFENAFTKHSIALINITEASQIVRASLFYALCNVSFLAETSWDFGLSQFHSNTAVSITEHRYGAMQKPLLNVMGPYFEESRLKENGFPPDPVAAPSPGEVQRTRLMSLRDAMLLSKLYDMYGTNTTSWPLLLPSKWPQNFSEFTSFLEHYRLHGPENERAQPRGVPFDHSEDKGFFADDYLVKSLPYLLNPIRRLPGFMGAPQALLSPIYSVKTGSGAMPTEMRVSLKAEDFVQRCHLPKVMFMPSGRLEIHSYGLVENSNSRSTRASALTQISFFDIISLRSQKHFEEISVDAVPLKTNSNIMIGPEFTTRLGGTVEPSEFTGVVGLKNSKDGLIGSPQIAMFFGDEGLQETPGTKPFTDANSDIALQSLISEFGTSSKANRMFDSSLEGNAVSIFKNGEAECDLSPFGGVLLNSRFQGAGRTHVIFNRDISAIWNDTLYWSLIDPSSGPPIIDLSAGTSVGSQVKQGHISLWFRIPTAYPWTSKHGNAKDAIGTFHTIFSLTFWEALDSVDLGFQSAVPIYIHAGFVRNESTEKNQIIVRWEQRDVSPNISINGDAFGHKVDRASVWSGPVSLTPSDSSPADNDYLGIPDFTFSRWKDNETRTVERIIHLKNTKENEPGSWHRLQVGWNIRNVNVGSNIDNLFWARLRDETNVDTYTTSIDLFGPDMQVLGSNHPMMTFHLGEMTSANSKTTENRAYRDLFPGYVLNSCVDDVQVIFGSNPPGFTHFNDTGYFDGSDPTRRYPVNAISEPQWVVDPLQHQDKKIPLNSNLIHWSAQIFHPEDSESPPNIPTVQMELVRGIVSLPPFYTSVVSPLFVNQDEHSQYYGQTVELDGDLKFLLRYLNQKPDFDGDVTNNVGRPLVSDSVEDDFTEIPWIKELTFRVQPKEYPKVLNWINQ